MAYLKNHPTRGYGLLEPLLAKWRASIANRFIPVAHRDGRILDVGCGSSPYFLSHTFFKEKFAIEQQSPRSPHTDINWYSHDLNIDPSLPFESNYFNVVTMLAVIEHLNPENVVNLFRETNRVLCPGGLVFVTTPAAWSGFLLNLFANLKLVSKEEIKEHVYAYTLPLIGWYFGKASFDMDKVQFGYFEMYLNMWAAAKK
ncbi:MAG: class I SAM-dependent methyltransferase [Anaerolineales bacterium]|jgi:SAM-dependent methyltransferase